MNLVVILPTRQNKPLIEKIQKKLSEKDRLVAVDFPKLFTRKLDEIIWKDINTPDCSILFISPSVSDITDDFIEVFKSFAGETENILIRSPLEEFDDFYFTSDINLLRPTDCFLIQKSLYKRQFGDISPHSDYMAILKEMVRSIGRGSFYTPLRDQKKLVELFKLEEEDRRRDEEKKKDALMQKLTTIKERRKQREQERNNRILDLEKLREEISRLEEELSRQEEELSRQEAEFLNSENIYITEIQKKENELKSVRLRIADKEIFLKRIQDTESSKAYIEKISNEIEEYKKREQELINTPVSPPENIKDNLRKISLKKRISHQKEKKRVRKQWMEEDKDTRQLVLSKEPSTTEKITKVKKIDWD